MTGLVAQESDLLSGPRNCWAHFALGLVLLWTGDAFAQQSPLDGDLSAQLKQVFHDVAAGYEITTGGEGESQRLPLRDEPIMHWLSLDSVKGAHVGSVFVWTHKQRPAVVGTIFTWDAAQAKMPGCEEFYSYSSDQLSVRAGSGKVWRPAPSGEMQRIPDAPVPAKSPTGRRLQLRKMSREFSGRMNRRGEYHPLRLLPRPVYEYESDDAQILGGALFMLVAYTTDPDILLLIEARNTANGPKWFYQPARFSDKSLWLTYRESIIWTSLREGHGTDQPQPDDPQYHVEYVKFDAPPEREPGETALPPKP